ncbi:MAG TPA: Rieske 2Fe-2S domain-containing protein, partial [Chloroflexota bacterium]
MLTTEENELLTRIGPGTPCGDLLRSYWQPVFFAHELTPEHPKARIKILDEELVIFRDDDGNYGLVGEHCQHRGASLYYGFLEDGCIRCAYHGWMYDKSGKCIEQPFEPAQSMLKHTIRHPAYPVQELAGVLWAYMGPPDKQPVLPHWDLLVREDGAREWEVHPALACNWLQCEENTADVTHTFFLHSYSFYKRGLFDGSGFGRPFVDYGFQPFEWGLLKSWTYSGDRGGFGWGNLLVFPNMLRLANQMHWRVPVDDTHTRLFWLNFQPTRDESAGGTWTRGFGDGEGQTRPEKVVEANGVRVRYEGTWLDERGEYGVDTFPSQDTMAWETQGPIFDRSKEHIGASDAGLTWFRQTVHEQIERVQQGEDPMALIRDPEQQEVDLLPWFSDASRWFANGKPHPQDQVFDSQLQTVEVPPGTARNGVPRLEGAPPARVRSSIA